MVQLEQAVNAIADDIGHDAESIELRKAALEIGASDIALLQQLHVLLTPHHAHVQQILRNFLEQFDTSSSATVIADSESLASARRIYFELLTTGHYEAEYANSRLQIAALQHRLGVTPQWTIAAYRKYLAELLALLPELILDADQRQRTGEALLKVVCLDLAYAVDVHVASECRDLAAIKDYAEQIVASMPNGLMIVDKQLNVRSMNRAMREIFALAQFEDPGTPQRELKSLAQCKDLSRAVMQMLEEGAAQHELIVPIPGKGTTRYIQFTL